jgi:sugar lactone lactonase YvrE
VQVHTPGTASSLLYLASTQSPSFSVIDFTNPTPGTATRLPYIPNSLVMSQDGSTLYFGSSTELMTVSTGNNTLTNENLNVPGKVLAVSPDNTQVLISNPVRGVFYLLTNTSKTSTIQTFGGTGTSAKWSIDGTTVYIAGGNAMYIYNTFTGFHTFDATSVLANDVAIAVPAEAGFFAGSATTARGACPDTTKTPTDYYPVAANAAATTDHITATNDGKHILGVGTGNMFYDIGITIPGGACPATTGITIPTTPSQTTLTGVNASMFNSVVASPDSTLGVVTYTPAGSAAGAPLPVYNVPATGLGTLQNVLLAGATAPVSAIFSPDGTALYVGTAGDDKLHVVAVPGLTDTLQLATNLVNLQNNPVPADLIAVRPRPVT